MFWFAVRHKDRLRTVPLSLPDDIEEVKDVDYFGDGKSEHMLDIYFRSGENTGRPVVLSIHGGGWMSGGKQPKFLRPPCGARLHGVQRELLSRAESLPP